MRRKKRLMRAMFAEALEIPEELALDLPRITLVGNINLNVENHKGIIAYSSSEVRLRISDGYLVARGAGFALRSISRTDVFLEGEINNLAIVLDMKGDGGVLSEQDMAELLAEELAGEEEGGQPKPEPAGEAEAGNMGKGGGNR